MEGAASGSWHAVRARWIMNFSPFLSRDPRREKKRPNELQGMLFCSAQRSVLGRFQILTRRSKRALICPCLWFAWVVLFSEWRRRRPSHCCWVKGWPGVRVESQYLVRGLPGPPCLGRGLAASSEWGVVPGPGFAEPLPVCCCTSGHIFRRCVFAPRRCTGLSFIRLS